MLLKLLLLFTIVPLVELALLIWLATIISFWPTIGLVIGTAVIGAVLGKLEGIRAWAAIKRDLSEGRIPADSLLDGLAVLVAGIFLVTPGVLTDIAAIVLLIPFLRKPLRNRVRSRFKDMMEAGTVSYISGRAAQSPFGSPFESSGYGEEIIDVTPDEDDADSTEPPSGASLRHN